ncbi:MAG: DUF2177 family protein [Spirosomaceae bacterium]|nr:DUF2177 family protein [Spirosomataceae bacterium]
MTTLIHFILTLLVYSILDLAFINLFAKEFIRRQVGAMLAPSPDLKAAVVFYLIFITTLLYFCVYPAYEIRSMNKSIINGALFGLVTYGTYELVNKSLLANWPVQMVIVSVDGIFENVNCLPHPTLLIVEGWG